MKILLVQNKNVFDITELTTSKSWGGNIKAAPRNFSTSIVKNEDINIDLGDSINLLDDSNNVLFEGFIFNKSIDKNGTVKIKCYDKLFYFANNSDIFTFKNKTIGDVIVAMCKRFDIQYQIVGNSKYKIPSLPIKELSLWEYFKLATKSTFDATGERFILRVNKGKIKLLKRRNQVQEWVVESGGNLINFSYSESAENLKTKIKLVNKEDKKTIIATTQDDDLIEKFGKLQHYENVSEKTNQAALNQKAKQMLKEKSRIEKSFSVECVGINNIKSGDAVFANIPILKVKKAYYIQSDKHNYFDGKHTMNLKLTSALDLEV